MYTTVGYPTNLSAIIAGHHSWRDSWRGARRNTDGRAPGDYRRAIVVVSAVVVRRIAVAVAVVVEESESVRRREPRACRYEGVEVIGWVVVPAGGQGPCPAQRPDIGRRERLRAVEAP